MVETGYIQHAIIVHVKEGLGQRYRVPREFVQDAAVRQIPTTVDITRNLRRREAIGASTPTDIIQWLTQSGRVQILTLLLVMPKSGLGWQKHNL